MQNSPYSQNDPGAWPGYTDQAPPPRRHKLFTYGIAGAILLCVVFGAGITINILTRPGCLSASDYQELTGVPYADTLEPTTSFYSTPVDFSETATPNLTASSKTELQSFGRFYQEHQNKSLRFTLSGTYSHDDQKTIATKQILVIQQALTEAGIPSDRVVVTQPELIANEEEDMPPMQSSTVSITSIEGCR